MTQLQLRRLSLVAMLCGAATACQGDIAGGRGGESPPGPEPTTPTGPRPGGPPTGTSTTPGPTTPPGTTAPPPGTTAPPFNPTAPPAGPTCGGISPTRLWKLTPEQYTRTVQALLGTKLRPTDELEQGLATEAGAAVITQPHAAALYDVARNLANEAVLDPAKLAPCLATLPAPATCTEPFVKDFLGRAFRRDAAADEVDRFHAFLEARATGATDPKTGLRDFLRVVLTSPAFLFRTELGPSGGAAGKTVQLTGFEKASALSYFLTDGPPDAELMAAARSGALEQKDQVLAHARRLLKTAATAPGLLAFFREQFNTEQVLAVSKDTAVFKDWSGNVSADMAREADLFVEDVLFTQGATLERLLTSPATLVSERLLTRVYRMPAQMIPAGEFRKITAPENTRAGILTLGATMAPLATPKETAPVARGKFVLSQLLCVTPPKPEDVPPLPEAVGKTQRERLAPHTQIPGCASCHSLFDPLGLAFETYDAMGRHRTMDGTNPIDATGAIPVGDMAGKKFANALELAGLLAKSTDVHACLSGRLYARAQGYSALPTDRTCDAQRVAQKFAASGGNFIELAAAIATDDSFFTRSVAP